MGTRRKFSKEFKAEAVALVSNPLTLPARLHSFFLFDYNLTHSRNIERASFLSKVTVTAQTTEFFLNLSRTISDGSTSRWERDPFCFR